MLIGEGLTGPAFPESTSIQIRSVRSKIQLYLFHSGKPLTPILFVLNHRGRTRARTTTIKTGNAPGTTLL